MGIGDVFARAWDLWRRDVGWLILAGLVVGLIMAVVFAITYGIFAALLAGAGTAFVAGSRASAPGFTGLGLGLGVAGVVVYLVAMFLVQVLAMTFYGGMFGMVIGSYRARRDVAFGDLFNGFRRFGSYALYALVLLGISLGLALLGLIPFLGGLIALVASVWITIVWMYVLPLIADQGLTFPEAAAKSRQMVGSAGWWWTFGMVLLLGFAALVLIAVVTALAILFGRADTAAGVVVAILLLLVFAVLFPPYAVCYVSVLYVGSGGDLVASPAGGGTGGGVPPAPPAPPAPGWSTVPSAAGGPPAAPGSADAWRAAADPLAAPPPPPPPGRPEPPLG